MKIIFVQEHTMAKEKKFMLANQENNLTLNIHTGANNFGSFLTVKRTVT